MYEYDFVYTHKQVYVSCTSITRGFLSSIMKITCTGKIMKAILGFVINISKSLIMPPNGRNCENIFGGYFASKEQGALEKYRIFEK